MCRRGGKKIKKEGIVAKIENSDWIRRQSAIFFFFFENICMCVFWLEKQGVAPLQTSYNNIVRSYAHPARGISAVRRSVATMSKETHVSFVF